MKHPTWKVKKWSRKDEATGTVNLQCDCGKDAECPVAGAGVIVEACIGMGIVTDPATPKPPGYMPEQIECRKCGRNYEIDDKKGGGDVR